jgi:hypothetical protein
MAVEEVPTRGNSQKMVGALIDRYRDKFDLDPEVLDWLQELVRSVPLQAWCALGNEGRSNFLKRADNPPCQLNTTQVAMRVMRGLQDAKMTEQKPDA